MNMPISCRRLGRQLKGSAGQRRGLRLELSERHRWDSSPAPRGPKATTRPPTACTPPSRQFQDPDARPPTAGARISTPSCGPRYRPRARLGPTPPHLLRVPDAPAAARLLRAAGPTDERLAALLLSPNLERPAARLARSLSSTRRPSCRRSRWRQSTAPIRADERRSARSRPSGSERWAKPGLGGISRAGPSPRQLSPAASA